MKDTKHIRRDFYSVAWIMPQGWDFRRWGCPGGQFFFFKHAHVTYQIDENDQQNRMQVKFYPRVKLVTFGWGQSSNIIKFRLPCQFQRVLYQTLCVFSQTKDTKHIRRDCYIVAWVMSQGWDFGALGVPRGSKKISTMVMWHIKSTGMTSRTECKYYFYPRVKLVTLGRGQKVKYHLHVNFEDFYTILCVCSHK